MELILAGEHRRIVVSAENIRGERNSMEKNCIIVFPPRRFSSSRRFSIKLKIVRERRINFRKSNQLRLDSGRYSTEACSILQAIKNFFSLEGIIYGALAPTV